MPILTTNKFSLDMTEVALMYPGKRVIPILSTSIIEDTELISDLLRYKTRLEMEYDVPASLDYPTHTLRIWWQIVLMGYLARTRIVNTATQEFLPKIYEKADSICSSLGYTLQYYHGSNIVRDLSTGMEIHPYLLEEHVKIKLLLSLLMKNGMIDSDTLIYTTEHIRDILSGYLATLESWGVSMVVISKK